VSPPRARLVFRVGIVGHRPDRLPDDPKRLAQLRATLRAILSEVQAALAHQMAMGDEHFYAGDAPQLRAVSPLAEGSDRIFAEEALGLGYSLCTPMPFWQEEFEKDFKPGQEPDSLQHFREILARAATGIELSLFELDGARTDAGEAYAAAGRVVLNQSDLLVAVWDGGAAAGRGGTVDTLQEAMRFHVPVVWVDALAPENWQIVTDLEALVRAATGGRAQPRDEGESLQQGIRQIVATDIRMPSGVPGTASEGFDYFRQSRPWFNFASAWKIFRDLFGSGRLRIPALKTRDFVEAAHKEWPTRSDAHHTSALSDWVNSRLRPHYAWADGLADLYADAHRSAFILSYLLSASAVLIALLPMTIVSGGPALEAACTIGEFAILVVILGLLRLGRAHRWHEHWMEYRLLAEMIRQLRFQIPLGGGRPLIRVPAHLAVYGDPAQTWMYWHVRAIARDIGIPNARVTQAYVQDCLSFLRTLVGSPKEGQWGFHTLSAIRAGNTARNLRWLSVGLFAATLLDVGIRIVPYLVPAMHGLISESLARWLVMGSAALPAFGAAFEGIAFQGEFARVAKRSAAMASGFEKYARLIQNLSARKDPPPQLADVVPVSDTIAHAMVDEVVDWRTVFIDRG
jgi:hypothetical protein